jgi:hypothetical protein
MTQPQPNVQQFPQVPPAFRMADPPAGPQADDATGEMVAMLQAIASICATRVLLMIAVLFGAGMWSFVVYDPSQLRIVAAAVYSGMTVLPLVALYWRKAC